MENAIVIAYATLSNRTITILIERLVESLQTIISQPNLTPKISFQSNLSSRDVA